jgi:hypothetical protein
MHARERAPNVQAQTLLSVWPCRAHLSHPRAPTPLVSAAEHTLYSSCTAFIFT